MKGTNSPDFPVYHRFVQDNNGIPIKKIISSPEDENRPMVFHEN